MAAVGIKSRITVFKMRLQVYKQQQQEEDAPNVLYIQYVRVKML